jgi:uncharacterized membrane protein YgcG
VRRPYGRRGGALAASLCALAWLLPARPLCADRGGFVIESFHTDLEVLASTDLLVEERIEVRFLEPRHGLYRTVPVRYTDPRGYAYSLEFELDDVTDAAGSAHDVRVRNRGRYVEVRMGDARRTVSGVVVYRLSYRIRRALGHFPEYDELYWNAVGHEFDAPIERASASVRLPAGFAEPDLRVAAYAGGFGSEGREVDISFPEPGVVRFATRRSLGPLEGLTVAVGWPKGAVVAPGAVDRIGRFLVANWILLAPILSLAWLWRRYRSAGRDPAGRGSIVVRYEPPPGATPGEIGTVVDQRVDMRDITATLVDLAVRGHLRISIDERTALFGLLDREEIVFERRGPTASTPLLPHERRTLDGVFGGSERVELSDLKEKFYREIPGIRDALQQRMVEQGWFTDAAHRVRQRWTLVGVGAGFAVVFAGLAWAKLSGGVFPHAAVVPIVAALATGLSFLLFAQAMPQRTRAGVDLRAWALGFEEFVERVEADRLEGDRRRGVFEALLPYAMALGVAAAWARRFDGIYEREAPAWFVGSTAGRTLSTVHLESQLAGAMGRAGQVMASAPRSQGSSGSGGGGFSGGGGGGGGGGSW